MKGIMVLGEEINDIEYSGKAADWKGLKRALLEKRSFREDYFQMLIYDNAKSQIDEDKLLAAIDEGDKSEHLYYQLYAYLEREITEEQASVIASIIQYKKHPIETFRGKIDKTKKIDGNTFSTKSASFIFEELGEPDSWGYVSVSQYFVQHDTCFCLSFRYSLPADSVEKSKAPRPELALVDGEELIAKLKKSRKLASFKKKYKHIYAGFLMDR
jgi:hypothetical protein